MPSNPSSAFGLLLHRSLACVRREPGEGASESGEGASGTCSPCTAALELSLWNLPPRPAPLFFRVPKATSRRLQTLPSAFGLYLHRSLACVRREPGEGASGTCSPCTAALELSPGTCHLGLHLFCLGPRRQRPGAFKSLPAPSNPSRHLWPSPATQPCAAPVCPVVSWLPDDWSILCFFVSRLRS